MRFTGSERIEFIRKLGQAASHITPRELTILLDVGWRERKTAAWLIAVAGRTEFSERLGELLLASEGPYAGRAYCVALATFGTPADADFLVVYLDHYLRHPELYYDQPFALGALLYIDTKLGIQRAARFLTEDGLWQQWIEGPPSKESDPDQCRSHIGELCLFAEETARHYTAQD